MDADNKHTHYYTKMTTDDATDIEEAAPPPPGVPREAIRARAARAAQEEAAQHACLALLQHWALPYLAVLAFLAVAGLAVLFTLQALHVL